MPTVWVANEAGHDYTDAERYGDVKPLTLGDINPLQLDRVCYHLARGIAKYAKEDDFLLISGTPMVNAAALSIWLSRFRVAKVLQWNAKRRKYIFMTITLSQIESLIERELQR